MNQQQTNKNEMCTLGDANESHIVKKKKQGGFLSLELIAVLVAVAAIMGGVMEVIKQMNDASARRTVQSDISVIATGVSDWAGDVIDYTGVSMTALSGDEYIPSRYGDGVSKNPLGGNYVVAVDGSDTRKYTIQITGLTASMCKQIAKKTEGGACSSTTVTVTKG